MKACYYQCGSLNKAVLVFSRLKTGLLFDAAGLLSLYDFRVSMFLRGRLGVNIQGAKAPKMYRRTSTPFRTGKQHNQDNNLHSPIINPLHPFTASRPYFFALDADVRFRAHLSTDIFFRRVHHRHPPPLPQLQIPRESHAAPPSNLITLHVSRRRDAPLPRHLDMETVRFRHLIQVFARRLGRSAELARAEQPDAMGDEDAAFDDDADDEEAAAQRIERTLRDDAHEGEEGTEPVDGEEEEIDADDAAGSLPEFKVWGEETGGE